MLRLRRIATRTLKAFYDDQMTHHAAALTYYSLMSLFPAALLGLSLLGLLGQYPETYNAIVGYLEDGTMIVVEGGVRFMDRDVPITVTRVLQTVAGRMIFAQPRADAA
jgi:uncharacterized BrkB/YihY/UPF0761 family membrane protein